MVGDSPVLYQQMIELALKYAAPHVIRGLRFNRTAQFILAQVYWQGVVNGYEAAIREGEE